MITPSGDLVLSSRDAAALRRVLALGISVLERQNGGAPAETVRLFAEVTEAASRCRPLKRRSGAVSRHEGVGMAADSAGSVLDKETLLTTEAAAVAECSLRIVQRAAAKGAFIARRAATGAWEIDTASFVAWLNR